MNIIDMNFFQENHLKLKVLILYLFRYFELNMYLKFTQLLTQHYLNLLLNFLDHCLIYFLL